VAERDKDAADVRVGQEELERSSQVFLTEIERLKELELSKIDLAPGDDSRTMLAKEIEDITVGLLSLGRYQTRLVQLEAEAVGRAGDGVREPALILQEWRAAEGRLHEARTAMERASDEVDRLRDEHRESLRRRSG